MSDSAERPSNLLKAKTSRNRTRRKGGRRLGAIAHWAAIFLLSVLLAVAGFAGFTLDAEVGRIIQGVSIGPVDVSGLTPEEATAKVEESVRAFSLSLLDGKTRISVAAAVPETGLLQPIARYDVVGAVSRAMAVGRDNDTMAGTVDRLQAYLFDTTIELPVRLDRSTLADAIRAKLPQPPDPPRDAAFSVDLDAAGSPTIAIEPERSGYRLDLDGVIRAAENRLKTLSETPVALRFYEDMPSVRAVDLQPLESAVAPALERAPLELQAKTLRWSTSKHQLASWLTAVKNDDGTYRLGLDRERAGSDLRSRATSVATAPSDAEFEEKDGRVIKFVPSVDGEELDPDAAVTALEQAVFGATPAAQPLDLLMRRIPPTKDTAAASQPWGFKEVIGIGESNFRGSPQNRRTNINVGAKSINGVIIPTDTEFSLMKALGTIDGTKGYVKELVIKKDKTTPEYGGGLCQIGTTTFRAVIAAGLPVTMRRNHSYRVPYYERDGAGNYIGPGKDATIYDPWPDFKFKNDTGNAVMLLTAVNGNRLTFTLWGVSDGRKAEQSDSRVYNIVPPPEKKEIPSTDLPPGKKKCTESAHAGADAAFTYTVTYGNGEVVKKDFFSHYVPWGEVCLIGVDPNAPVPAPGTELPSADAAGAAGTPTNGTKTP